MSVTDTEQQNKIRESQEAFAHGNENLHVAFFLPTFQPYPV